MGYEFTLNAAQQIVAAVKKIRASSTEMTGAANPAMPVGTSFWAAIVDVGDISGKFYDWIAVVPDSGGIGAAGISTSIGRSSSWKIAEPQIVGLSNAREASDTTGIPMGTVVRMEFAGYGVFQGSGNANAPGTSVGNALSSDLTSADGSVPFYIFSYNLQTFSSAVPPHDHRDNFNGGFAFAVFHPGTDIPQMPWSI